MPEHPEQPQAGIRAQGLHRHYGERVAVCDVSFEVRTGEVFGLLGPNGAGKTTLLRMLAGILQPTAGSAHIMGTHVGDDPVTAKSKLGFLSGDTALYRRLSVRETLTWFGRLYRMPPETLDARIETVIRDFGLEAIVDQRCGALSTGQNQRVNLARAFIANPAALILDEPTTGLDVISGRFVIEAVERARDAGKAVLFSTHIMSEADELCDRVGLLVRGVLREVGTREAILERTGTSSFGELLVRLHAEHEVA